MRSDIAFFSSYYISQQITKRGVKPLPLGMGI